MLKAKCDKVLSKPEVLAGIGFMCLSGREDLFGCHDAVDGGGKSGVHRHLV